jgi:hypothetical protein
MVKNLLAVCFGTCQRQDGGYHCGVIVVFIAEIIAQERIHLMRIEQEYDPTSQGKLGSTLTEYVKS